jgi:hypothetical protein
MIEPLTYLRAVCDDRVLTCTERMVALAIMRHAGADGYRSHPGHALLSAETGLSKRYVSTICRRLEEKKWVIVTYSGRGGAHDKANEYDLNIPSQSELSDIPK